MDAPSVLVQESPLIALSECKKRKKAKYNRNAISDEKPIKINQQSPKMSFLLVRGLDVHWLSWQHSSVERRHNSSLPV